MTTDEISSKILSFLEKKSRVLKVSEIRPDTALFSSGALDSLTFVQLIAFLDKEFKIRLSNVTALSLDNFDNLEKITGLIKQAEQKK